MTMPHAAMTPIAPLPPQSLIGQTFQRALFCADTGYALMAFA